MISRLQGIILEKVPPELVINVNGVGYEVHASMHTFYRLPEIGQKVDLYMHFIVREDAHILFGFFDRDERSMFRALIKVNGVGPKLALAILSSVTPEEFARLVLENNSNALVKLPGVGKKTAERLLVEMRDKLKDHAVHSSSTRLNFDITPLVLVPEQEATSALVALGYKPQEASRAIARFDVSGLSSQEIIRKALQNMNSA